MLRYASDDDILILNDEDSINIIIIIYILETIALLRSQLCRACEPEL